MGVVVAFVNVGEGGGVASMDGGSRTYTMSKNSMVVRVRRRLSHRLLLAMAA